MIKGQDEKYVYLTVDVDTIEEEGTYWDETRIRISWEDVRILAKALDTVSTNQ